MVDVYSDDDYSGLYDDRPEFDRLIRDGKLGKFNVVIPKTGTDKVNLCPISMGGSVAVEYLQMFKEDYDIIKNIV